MSHTDVVVVPAMMFGVQVTGACETTPDSGTAAPAGNDKPTLESTTTAATPITVLRPMFLRCI